MGRGSPSDKRVFSTSTAAVLLTSPFILLTAFEAARDEMSLFLESSVEVLPFIVLAVLAYSGEKDRRVRPVAVIWCMLLVISIALFSFALVAVTLYGTSVPENISGGSSVKMAGLCLLPVLFSMAGLLSGFRAFCSRHIPIDPRSFVHSIALAMMIAVTLLPPVPLIATGIPPLLSPIVQSSLDLMQMGGTAQTVRLFSYSLFWSILGSFMMVGLFVKRDLRQSFDRLAFVLPTIGQVLIALCFAVMMVVAFSIIDEAIRAFWEMMGWRTTDPELVVILFQSALTPVGVLALSISAGVGEELAVRGVLQPRFGMVWPSVVFASLHAYQYGWDALLSVFLAGMAFATLRKYTNTTTCAIAHTIYDLSLFILIMIGFT